jgi:hypothetical protein
LGNPELFEGQVHDFNPGIRPNGLFWTSLVSPGDVKVDLAEGTATLAVRNIHQIDHFDFENAILGNGDPPKPAIVSFTVKWTASGPVNNWDNPAQHFRGQFRDAVAQMEWSGRSGDYVFQSAPLETSVNVASELGSEANGVFYS